MPTPEEIKKIAREYAENVKSECVSAKLIETLVMGFYHTRLKNDYCIVPKEEIYMRHGVALALMEQDPSHKEFYRGQSSVLESIFGKSLFNEEK